MMATNNFTMKTMMIRAADTHHPGKLLRLAGVLVRQRYTDLAGTVGIFEVFQVYGGGKLTLDTEYIHLCKYRRIMPCRLH